MRVRVVNEANGFGAAGTGDAGDGDRGDRRGAGREVAAPRQDLRRGLHSASHGRPDARLGPRGAGDRPRLRRQDLPRARSRATATSWSRSCTASSARSRSSTRSRSGRRSPCSRSPRSTASSCSRTTTGTPRRPCSPSSCSFHAGPRCPLWPGHRPAAGRGLPHRHEHRSRQHSDRPGLARRGDPVLLVEPDRRSARDGSARAVHARLAARRRLPSTSPSTTATGRAGSTRSTRR